MEGLSPLGQAASEYAHRKVGEDADIYIGMDIALGLGDPACIICTAIMIPVYSIISIPCTRNEILPIKLISRSMLHDTNGSIKQ